MTNRDWRIRIPVTSHPYGTLRQDGTAAPREDAMLLTVAAPDESTAVSNVAGAIQWLVEDGPDAVAAMTERRRREHRCVKCGAEWRAGHPHCCPPIEGYTGRPHPSCQHSAQDWWISGGKTVCRECDGKLTLPVRFDHLWAQNWNTRIGDSRGSIGLLNLRGADGVSVRIEGPAGSWPETIGRANAAQDTPDIPRNLVLTIDVPRCRCGRPTDQYGVHKEACLDHPEIQRLRGLLNAERQSAERARNAEVRAETQLCDVRAQLSDAKARLKTAETLEAQLRKDYVVACDDRNAWKAKAEAQVSVALGDARRAQIKAEEEATRARSGFERTAQRLYGQIRSLEFSAAQDRKTIDTKTFEAGAWKRDHDTMLANLTATQERCTQLLDEVRDARKLETELREQVASIPTIRRAALETAAQIVEIAVAPPAEVARCIRAQGTAQR